MDKSTYAMGLDCSKRTSAYDGGEGPIICHFGAYVLIT